MTYEVAWTLKAVIYVHGYSTIMFNVMSYNFIAGFHGHRVSVLDCRGMVSISAYMTEEYLSFISLLGGRATHYSLSSALKGQKQLK